MARWCRGYWSSQGRVEKGWNWVAECNNLGGAYIRKNVFFLRWAPRRLLATESDRAATMIEKLLTAALRLDLFGFYEIIPLEGSQMIANQKQSAQLGNLARTEQQAN